MSRADDRTLREVLTALEGISPSTGGATADKQDTGNASLASIDTKLTGPLPVSGTFFQATQPVSGTVSVSNFPATQPVSGTVTATGPLTDTQLRASAVPVSGTFFQATQPISATSLPLPSLASTAALQTQPGVDIGDVTINNSTGAAAVNIQDGGNSITIDGAVSFTAPQHVIADSGTISTITNVVHVDDNSGSLTVDNAGTFAVQATIGAGAAIIGKVGIDQTTPGTTNAVSVTNSSFAVTGPLTDTQLRATAVPVSGTVTATGPLTDTQLRATAVPVSGTVTATGPLTDTQLRATAVPVSLSAETTKVIGTVNISTSQTVGLVAGSQVIGHVIVDSGTVSTITNVVHVDDNSGSITVDGSVTALTAFATASNTRVAVTSGSTVQLLASASTRKYACISNNTGFQFYLMLGAAAVVGQGIPLSNGGVYEITADNLWTGTVNAISSSSTSASLDIFEGTP